MFTGIIEEIGTVKSIIKKGNAEHIAIQANLILSDISQGESVAVNGVCLTITGFSQHSFEVDVMAETLQRSNIGKLRIMSHVNLERALPLGGRVGGHLVTGHIDGKGTIQTIKKDGIASWYEIRTTKEIMKYIIFKGSVAIDGISVTVAKRERSSFSFSTIPHTRKNTILGQCCVGDLVNIENDQIGKYVDHLMQGSQQREREVFKKHGFLEE
jgi:riboflavin synthase